MKGILILKLIEARHLESKDFSGLSDPYFVFIYGTQRATSKIHYQTLSTVYQETFNFLVDSGSSTLRIEAYDKERMGKDHHMGHYTLDFSQLENYRPVTGWHTLEHAKRGEMHLTTTFISLESSDGRIRDAFGFLAESVPQNPLQISSENADKKSKFRNPFGFIPLPTSPSLAPHHVGPKFPVDQKGRLLDIHELPKEKLARDGIPIVNRPEMWSVHSGAKQKQDASPNLYSQLVAQLDKVHPEDAEQIEKDLPRTFPDHPFYAPGAPGVEVLRRLLSAYSIHNVKISYCQGMNFVAGIILLFLQEEDAFWVLDSVVEDILPNYYDRHLGGLQVDIRLAEYYIMQYFPDLKLHLDIITASASINCMKWFLCIFVGIFPTETTLRIWDALFCTGRDVLLQTFLSIVRHRSREILHAKTAAEFYDLMVAPPPSLISSDPLFQQISKHFSRLYQVDKMRVASQKAITDVINKREELMLTGDTKFTIKELESLRHLFTKLSTKNTLTKQNFEMIIRDKFGENDTLFLDHMFKIFDKSGDGVVDFREFCTGLSAYARGSLEERLAFCFCLFDTNMDGFVQPDELLLVLRAQYHMMFPNEDLNYVKKFVEFASTFDVNKDGKFSLEEFKEVVERQPLIVQFLNLSKFTESPNAGVYSLKKR